MDQTGIQIQASSLQNCLSGMDYYLKLSMLRRSQWSQLIVIQCSKISQINTISYSEQSNQHKMLSRIVKLTQNKLSKIVKLTQNKLSRIVKSTQNKLYRIVTQNKLYRIVKLTKNKLYRIVTQNKSYRIFIFVKILQQKNLSTIAVAQWSELRDLAVVGLNPACTLTVSIPGCKTMQFRTAPLVIALHLDMKVGGLSDETFSKNMTLNHNKEIIFDSPKKSMHKSNFAVLHP